MEDLEKGYYWVRDKATKKLEISYYNSESYDKHDYFRPWDSYFPEDYYEVVEKVKLPEST